MSKEIKSKQNFVDAWITLGLVVLGALLYIPFIGSYPLWDPWEAHYSQVAMEMIWKNTWWEPWYRNSDRSFWSKPIFTFWVMLSSLKTFRIHQVGDFAQAEFYLRLPIALLGSIGTAYMYYFVRKLWNRRTGVICALILMTCPQYFLISRQIMVDIPFLVVQFAALGFFALGLFSKEEENNEEEKKSGVKGSLYIAGAFIAIQLVEVIYWKVQLKQSLGKTFIQGSYLWITLAAFFIIWAVVRNFVTKPQTRYFYLFFFFSGLAFLAKGLLSIVLPAGIALFYILITRDWDLLRRMRLVYVSDKISLKVSIIWGTISSLIAVWLITFPMFNNGGLSRVLRNVFAKSASFAKLKPVFAGIDKYFILPFAKLKPLIQIEITIGVFLGFALLAYIVGGEKGKEHLKAFLFPGMLLYLIVAGSWVCVMNFKQGLPFMDEWFIRHHFARYAGTIEKPQNTFDLYIKQIGFGMFPWSALIPIAIVRFLRWNGKDMLKRVRLRNIFFFCCFAFPYFFYTFSSTKFHHYIFPVVPFLAIMIGVWVNRLFKEGGAAKEKIGIGFSILIFALLAKDLTVNYKPLHQLFTYYTNRVTPPSVYPSYTFKVLFFIAGLVFVTFFMVRRLRPIQFALFLAPIMVFVLYTNVRLIPAVAQNYSFKSVYMAYKKIDGNKKSPFGEYSNWDERSTSFYSQNFSRYLSTPGVTRSFLRQKDPVYIMVSKNQMPMLQRLAKLEGKKVYPINKKHYDMWLVSTVWTGKTKFVLKKKPKMNTPHWKRLDCNFGNKVRLVGVRFDKPKGYKRGDKVKIIFLYKVIGKFRKNWRAFIHADPVRWTRNRLNWDHRFADGTYPTTEWKVGEYVQDIVEREIPKSFPTHYNGLNLYMGFWIGASRLPIVGRCYGARSDGKDRINPRRLKLVP